jgi:hypothetical protein
MLVNAADLPTSNENPFDAIHSALATSSADMGESRRDAWLYGIVVGWSDFDDPEAPGESAMQEVAAKHGWSAADVAQLKRLHAVYAEVNAHYAAIEKNKHPLSKGTRKRVLEYEKFDLVLHLNAAGHIDFYSSGQAPETALSDEEYERIWFAPTCRFARINSLGNFDRMELIENGERTGKTPYDWNEIPFAE